MTLLHKWKLLRAVTIDPKLSHADDAVAMVLLDHVDAKKGHSWISRPSIAAVTGLSERNVMRSLDRLASRGYFEATASRGRGNSQTFKPNYDTIEKETAPSPFTAIKKETAPSEKGDSACQKKETEQVEKRRQRCLPNPLSESAYEPTYESDYAREANDFELRVANEADFRAAFYARERAWEEAKESQLPDLATQSSSEPRTHHVEASEDAPQAPPAPPHSPSPRAAAAAAGGFSVNELSFGKTPGFVRNVVRHGGFATAAEARAARVVILLDKPENSGFRVEIRDPDGKPLPTEDPAPSAVTAAMPQTR